MPQTQSEAAGNFWRTSINFFGRRASVAVEPSVDRVRPFSPGPRACELGGAITGQPSLAWFQ